MSLKLSHASNLYWWDTYYVPGKHFLLGMRHFWVQNHVNNLYMVVQKIRSPVNNHCSIWLRIFLLFWGWVHENKAYQCTSWVGVYQNELPLSPAWTPRLSSILMLPETFMKELSMHIPRVIWKSGISVVVQRKGLEEKVQGKTMAGYDLQKSLQTPKAEFVSCCPQVQICPSILLSDSVAGKPFPRVPWQRPFYLILSTGGARGRLADEKRERDFLLFLSPCPVSQQWLLEGTPVSLSISRSSLCSNERFQQQLLGSVS